MILMPMASVASLIATVRDCRLLEPSQLDELTHDLQPRLADPRALARELVRRGWLTPYQVNQLAQGRGRRLSLGQYVLLERLGEGGMGEVFKARHRKLGRLVALKIIRKDRLANDLAVKRFCREIQAAAHLEHPNVVRAYDADEADGTHFFAMEYVEGTDLAKLVKQHGPLPVGQACDCVRQAALALQHAFERGMVHRDIKPHNLLLAADGVVKVLDMGLARLSPEDADGVSSFTTLTQEGAVMGTPDFIAPEQAMDSHTADIRADLYSLGCTSYYLLTGCVPFPRGSALEKLLRHQTEEPRPVEGLRPEVPAAVAAVVRRLMAKRPQDRFQTPAELAAAVARAAATPVAHADARPLAQPVEPVAETMMSEFAGLDTGDSSATTPLDALPRRKAERRRLLLIGVTGGGILLVLLALLVALLVRLGSPPRDTGKGPSVAADESAQADLDALLAREKDRAADRTRLWDDVVAFSLRHPARARDAHLGAMLLRLPSPLAALDPARVPAEARLDGLPKEAVAVLGEGLPWFGVTGAPHVAFSTDGSCVYCLIAGGAVGRADAVTGRLGPRFGPGLAATFDLRRDGKEMMTTWSDAVRFWDLTGPAPREARVLKDFPGQVITARYSRDGKTAAVALATKPPAIQLWDLSGGQPRRRGELKGFTEPHGPGDFSPDGKLLATYSTDGTLRLWDLTADPPTTRAVLETKERKWWTESASFSPDGTLLAWTGAHDWLVHVCDVTANPPKELAAFFMNTAAEGVVFSPDGTMLAAGLWGGGFALWDVNGKTITQRAVVPAHSGNVWSVSFSPDGKSLATASQDGTLRVWDITGREPKDRVARRGHAAGVTALAFAQDGKSLLSGSADETARVWDLTGAEPRERAVLRGHKGRVSGVGFASDRTPVTGSGVGLFLWDVATGKPRADLCQGGLPGPSSLAGSPDGRTFAAVGGDRMIRFWDLTRDPPGSRAVSTETKGLNPLTFSADGKTLAAGYEDGTIRLWGAAAVQPREWGTLHGQGQVLTLAFSPDGKTLASAGTNFAVTLWDVAGQKQTASLAGHTDQVRALAFSPDGRTLASAGIDGRVILWDPAPGRKEPKRREWKLPWPVSALATAPDGRHLAAGFSNGAAIILRLK
jgi:WD40 repeat protein/serine/threonine protein kinase